MNFGDVLSELENGKRAARTGWNGKDMWICLMPGVTIPECIVNGRTKKFWPNGDLPCLPYFVMKTADGKWQPGWLASQSDMLAEDWNSFE